MHHLSAAEHRFCQVALGHLQRIGAEQAPALAAVFSQLQDFARLTRAFPDRCTLPEGGQGERAEALCAAAGELGALHMPTAAVLGEALLVARIQWLRALRGAVFTHQAALPASLPGEAARWAGATLRMRILDEALVQAVRGTDLTGDARRRAAETLISLWEGRGGATIAAFHAALDALWSARRRVQRLGGQAGAFRRALAGLAPSLFDAALGREGAQALAELIHRPSAEESAAPGPTGSVLDEDFATQSLMVPAMTGARRWLVEADYACYRRRHRAAELRAWADRPGPRRTAEAWMLLRLLDQVEVTSALPAPELLRAAG